MVPDTTSQDKKSCSCEHSTTLFWCGPGKNIPVLHFRPDVCLYKNTECSCNKMVSSGVGLTYKFVKTECRLLRTLLEGHGFREIHQSSNDFNLMWCGCHVKPYTLRGLTELQKVNHFPRSYEITRKDRLYKNYMRMRQTMGAKHFDFLPVTFVLPSEVNEFYSTFQRERGFWIAKPVASSRGRGISIISHPNQVNLEEQVVVCRYISNPLLVDGFKFDLRIYVMVTSFDPLRIYVFNEGLARFSTVRYDGSPLNLNNMFMHLTNYSVNKKNAGYVKCSDPDIEDYGNKWSMSALLRYLKSEGYDTATMMMRIEDIIIKTLLSAEVPIANACRMFLPHRENCFELFGFDVIFDEDRKPWLLEVNLSPSLACESPLDLKIKSNLVSHMLTLAGVVALDPYSRRDYGATRRKSAVNGSYALSVDGTNAAPLSNEDLRLVRQTKEEFVRKGAFARIFPTEESWDLYNNFLENKTHYNFMLHTQLYPNRSKEKSRPSSAVVSMNKFREMNTSTSKMINYSTVYSGTKERYSRYEKSLQPLGTVEDYPPEALVDAITPDFSLPDDLTDTTKEDESATFDETSSVYSCEYDGVKRTIATQTLRDTESKACSPDSAIDSPDIPTDVRPLVEILAGIRRGCLRPLSFPECYHPIYSPPFSSTTYDRHTSVFTPTYSAFNPKTQTFELPLSRKERVTQYSMYVDRMNKSSSKVNLVDVKCQKSVLRLLPQRPRSGDLKKGEERALMSIVPNPKERERPGSLTLRTLPPEHRPIEKKPCDQKHMADQRRLNRPQEIPWSAAPTKQDPVVALYGYQADGALPRTQSGLLTRSNTNTSATNSGLARTRTLSFTRPSANTRPSTNTRPSANTRNPSYTSRQSISNAYRPREPINTSKTTYNRQVAPQVKRPSTRLEKPPPKVEIIRQSEIDFGYKKLLPSEILTYEKFLEEQKKRRSSSRPSSCHTLKSSFKDGPSNDCKTRAMIISKVNSTVSSRKPVTNVRKGVSKPRDQLPAKPKDQLPAKPKDQLPAKPKKAVKKPESKSTSEVSLITNSQVACRTSNASIVKGTKVTGTGDDVVEKCIKQLPPKVKKTSSQASVNTSIIEGKRPKKRNFRPSSASSRKSNDSRKGDVVEGKEKREEQVAVVKEKKREEQVAVVKETKPEDTGVNVSVFTRDNITVSPKDVIVLRTVNKDKTTILVTVPHSYDTLFTRTKIGKVEISLASPCPDSRPADQLDVEPIVTRSDSKITTKPPVPLQDEISRTQPPVPLQDETPCTKPSQQQEPQPRSVSSPDIPKDQKQQYKPKQATHPKLEIVDSGYGSPTSPVNLLNHRRKPVAVERSNSANKYKGEGSKAKPQSRPSPTPINLTKPRKVVKRRVSIQSEGKIHKPSPYGSNYLATQPETAGSTCRARPTVKPVRILSEQSPYGSPYTRYRLVHDHIDHQGSDRTRPAPGDDPDRRTRPHPGNQMRKRIEQYSSQVQQASAARSKELTSNSLPSIYRARRPLSHFDSDLALSRNRMLVGGVM